MVQAPPITIAPEETQSTQAAPWKDTASKSTSYVLLALIVLVVLDLAARLSYPYWPIDRYNSPNRSWIWWATNHYRSEPQAPDIVLMGSSLMMAAVHDGDATYLNTSQNVVLHHNSKYLEDLLQRKLHTRLRTGAFAIGGLMASDSYAIASTLFKGSSKPATIIYGIAPRDFMDNTFASPASTETFRYMSRVGNLSGVAFVARTTFWETLDYILSRISFIYAHKFDFLYLQVHSANELLNQLGYEEVGNSKQPIELRKLAMLEMPEDVSANELFVDPIILKYTKFLDNTKEYRARYSRFNKKQFSEQLKFLERFLNYCRNQHINVALVNMPLTKDNVDLMPPGFYQNYLDTVLKLSTEYDSKFIDLNQPALFPKSLFGDSAHLNGLGGQRFFEVLSDTLVKQPSILRKPN